jgi:predicted Rdx family selenoprotein
VFEVVIDDELVYSKKKTGKHADPNKVLSDLRARIG